MAGWSEQNIELGDLKLRIGRGGSGRPVLVLHHDIGTLDKLPFYEALSAQVRRHRAEPSRLWRKEPSAPQWLRHPRDIAALYQWLLAELGVERASLVGLGFGGWIAAEMAALAPRDFHRLVLVGAMGVKPPEGDINDQAIVSYIDYAKAGFHDPAGVRPHLRRRVDRPARRLGSVPRDELPHRLEALHVQPEPAASVGRGAARRRSSSGATTTRSCREAPASSMRKSLPNARL